MPKIHHSSKTSNQLLALLLIAVAVFALVAVYNTFFPTREVGYVTRGVGMEPQPFQKTQVHYACNSNLKCVQVSGPGPDGCTSDPDCAHNTHNECQFNPGYLGPDCVHVEGGGANLCTGKSYPFNDCNYNGNKHNECNAISGECVTVGGPGVDACNGFNNDCQKTHNECRNLKCIAVPGKGSDQCNLGHNENCHSTLRCVGVGYASRCSLDYSGQPSNCAVYGQVPCKLTTPG